MLQAEVDARDGQSRGLPLEKDVVCYLSVGGFAGVYRTLKQARTLAQQGARIMFVCYESSVPDAYRDAGFEIITVPRTQFLSSTQSWRMLRIAMNLTFNKARNYLLARKTHRAIEDAVVATKADVVQCVELFGLRTAYRASRRMRAKLVYDSNELWSGFLENPDLGMDPKQSERFLADERALAGRADLVLVTSDALAKRLSSDYSIEPPLTLLNAPDRVIRHPRPVGAPVRLVFHGGLSRDRNIEGLIRAMQFLKEEATLDIHGFDRTVDGNTLGRLVQELGLNDTVRICGPYEYASVVDLLQDYDIGVMANQIVDENFQYTLPNKVFDCMCAGLAIAMTASVSLGELLRDVPFGVPVDPSTPETIAVDLSRIIEDPDRLMRMKRAAVAAAPRYWWPEQERKLVDAFVRLLSRN